MTDSIEEDDTLCINCVSRWQDKPSDESAPRPLLEDIADLLRENFVLKTGPEKETVHFPKGLLLQDAPYFDKLTNGDFKEKGATCAEFQEFDTKAVELYKSLLMSQLFHRGLPDNVKVEWDNVTEDWLLMPLKAFVFANFVCSRKVTAMIFGYVAGRFWDRQGMEGFGSVSVEAVEVAWATLEPGHRMRRAIVEGVVISSFARQPGTPASLKQYPTDFIASVLLLTQVRMDLMEYQRSHLEPNDEPPSFSDGFLTRPRCHLREGWLPMYGREEVNADTGLCPNGLQYHRRSEVDPDVQVHCPRKENRYSDVSQINF